MAVIRPFAAWRYNAAVVGDLSKVVAPPYDVIDDAHRVALYERSPYNVVRLILGREADRYTAAAACMREWTAVQVLVQDSAPALYYYAQDFLLEGRSHQRGGVVGAVRLEPFSSGVIRPHEKTLAGPKADRLRLMEATATNLSPIFGLYPGTAPALEDARAKLGAIEALEDVTDEFGVRHRLWSLGGGDTASRIAAELAPRTIYIADGHHRYETALAYRDKLAASRLLPPEHAANFILMFLCSMADPGLVILPTHRLLAGLAGFDPARFLEGLRRFFVLRVLASDDAGSAQLLETMRRSQVTCLGFALRGSSSLYFAELRDPNVMDSEALEVAPALRHLEVSLLDAVVLRRLLGVDAHDAAHDGRLTYVKEAGEALDAVRAGRADVACLLTATRIEEVEAVCDAGETMPEKSTYFHPKLGSGFLFHSLR